MSNLLPPQMLEPNVDGVQVETTDWNALPTYLEATAGYAAMAAQGFANGLPQSASPWPPLTCTPGSALHVVVGSAATGTAPEWAFIDGVFAAALASQTFAVPSNSSGQTRQDIVCVQQIETQGSTVSRPVEGGGSATVPYNYSGMQFTYVEGTPGSGPPSPTSGYQVFAIITVPTGASSITTGDIAVQFTTMNPTGPAGPTGPGTTTLTANVTIPAIGGSVSLPVASGAPLEIGAQLLVVDNSGLTAMYAVVIGGGGSNTLLVMNAGKVAGYTNTGTIHSPGTVIFGTPPGTTFATASFTVPAVGSTVVVTVNDVSRWLINMFGFAFDPSGSDVFQFQVTNTNASAGTITLQNVGITFGSSGDTMNPGSLLNPTPQGVVYRPDDGSNPGGNTVVFITKRAVYVSGTSISVAFQNAFAAAGSYVITGLTPYSNSQPYVAGKTASGFTIELPGPTPGDVEWSVMGIENL